MGRRATDRGLAGGLLAFIVHADAAERSDAADALAIAIAAGHDGMAGFGEASGAADATAGGSGLEKAIAAALARDAGNGRGEG